MCYSSNILTIEEFPPDYKVRKLIDEWRSDLRRRPRGQSYLLKSPQTFCIDLELLRYWRPQKYVCKSWRIVCNDPSMWQVIDIPESGRRNADLRKMCRHAVDLNQGQLVDINLEYFASDKLLDYIAERCVKLRRLRHCDGLSDHGLKKSIERFPNLEEFHIILKSNSHIYDDVEATTETIGESCPLLRSFALNKKPQRYYTAPRTRGCDEVAYAIARSMPELRHLQLRENDLTNKGLKIILDSCPRLESLDLKRCYCVRLDGDLKEICSSQIKHLRWELYQYFLLGKHRLNRKLLWCGIFFKKRYITH